MIGCVKPRAGRISTNVAGVTTTQYGVQAHVGEHATSPDGPFTQFYVGKRSNCTKTGPISKRATKTAFPNIKGERIFPFAFLILSAAYFAGVSL